MWCCWVLRNRGWGKRSECSLWACLCFWHSTSGHHCGCCALQTLSGCLLMFTCWPKPQLLFLKKQAASFSAWKLLSWEKQPPVPLIQPLSTDHVGEVPMDKPGCCSTALGQFHAHKRSQGSVKAHSSLNSRPPNPFMLFYQITSPALCMCFMHRHAHTQQSWGGMPDVSVSFLGAIKPVVIMKEFIFHLFLLLKSNWVIEILIRLAFVFHLHCFSASLIPHLYFNCWSYTSVFKDFYVELESS